MQDLLQQRGGAHLLEERRPHVGIGAEPNAHAERAQRAHVADAVAEVLVGHWIVHDARAACGEPAPVVVADVDRVDRDRAFVKGAEVFEQTRSACG